MTTVRKMRKAAADATGMRGFFSGKKETVGPTQRVPERKKDGKIFLDHADYLDNIAFDSDLNRMHEKHPLHEQYLVKKADGTEIHYVNIGGKRKRRTRRNKKYNKKSKKHHKKRSYKKHAKKHHKKTHKKH